MSLYSAAQMGQQLASQQPGGVATGHVPQQPNLGLGPNRYVPPTFNWGRGGLDGRQPQYTQMDWNQMQGFYMPQQQNNTFTNPYMQQLQGMLGMFSNQYGGPNRQPTLSQFGSYNPGFGGPTSFYDQMRGGGMQNPEGFGDQFAVMPGSGPGPGADYFRSLFGGSGGRGGYPQMPQFNPYMLARNNMMGMDFNQMFDPRYAMLFGMGGLGAMTPNGPQQPSGLKPGQLGGGG